MKLYKEVQGNNYCECRTVISEGSLGAVIGMLHLAGLPRGGGDILLVLVLNVGFKDV